MTAPPSRVETFRQGEGALTAEMETYRGMVVHALPGLHAHAAALAMADFPAGARVLDLAAGSGAFALRLNEAGFAVTASDLLPESFRQGDTIPFVAADLNGQGPEAFPGPFDAVTALEIIEHLENPWRFARTLRGLLRPGGKLLLTTPNVEAATAVERWLRRGRHPFFDERHLAEYGHITPVTQYLLTRMLADAGFRDVRLSGFGTSRTGWDARGLRTWMMRRLMRRGGLVDGHILVAQATAGD